MPGSLVDGYQVFRGTYYLHFLSIPFYPEDGGETLIPMYQIIWHHVTEDHNVNLNRDFEIMFETVIV
jgi:hypothetical protein